MGGRLVYARGFGYADKDAKTPMRPDTLQRIASISKPITAVAVLQLVERGRLKLDDRVLDVLKLDTADGVPHDPRWRDVTVRHLLHHTGGWDREASFDPMFRSVEIAEHFETRPPAGAQQVIDYMLARDLDFTPGQKHAYSNFGYCLLGRVIEKVTGEPYEKAVQKRVLAPLGIRGMRIGRTLLKDRCEGESRYYMRSDETGPAVVGDSIGEPVPKPYGAWSLEAMDSHGGWIASAVDLVRFAAAFDEPARSPLLSAESVATMFVRPEGPAGWENGEGDEPKKPKEVWYGCGWGVREAGQSGGVNTWHMGGLDGTSTLLVRRHDGLNWAILCNTRQTPGGEQPARLLDPLMHQAVGKIEHWPEGDLFDELLPGDAK
jgi:N-acyl-D-amino-acid deacylase